METKKKLKKIRKQLTKKVKKISKSEETKEIDIGATTHAKDKINKKKITATKKFHFQNKNR